MEREGVRERESETDRQSEGKRESCRERRFVGGRETNCLFRNRWPNLTDKSSDNFLTHIITFLSTYLYLWSKNVQETDMINHYYGPGLTLDFSVPWSVQFFILWLSTIFYNKCMCCDARTVVYECKVHTVNLTSMKLALKENYHHFRNIRI